MHKVWVVAKREYLALVTTKSFWLGLLIPPLLGALTVLLALSGPTLGGDEPRRILLVDPHGIAAGLVKAGADQGFEVTVQPRPADGRAQREAWGAQLLRGELSAVVEVSPRVLQGEPVQIYVDNLASSSARWLGEALRDELQRQRLTRLGLSDSQVSELMQPVPIRTQRLVAGAKPASETSPEVGLALPFATVLFVLMGVMSGAVPLLQAVVEEKQQRISEVLLGAVSPAQLMLGKLLGTTAVGTTVLLCNLSFGLFFVVRAGLGSQVPVQVLLTATGISVLAMVMYGSVFLALGSASSELKDAQGLLMPVMVLFLAPMAALPLLAESPNHPLSIALSLFPLTSPLAMPVRMGVVQSVPSWQVALCFVAIVAATALTVFAAGRVFRIGVLSQGKLPSLKELGRWVLKG